MVQDRLNGEVERTTERADLPAGNQGPPRSVRSAYSTLTFVVALGGFAIAIWVLGKLWQILLALGG